MDVKCLIVLFGSTGRIGKALLNFLAPEHSVSCLHFVPGTLAALLLPAERIVFVLAVPSSVAEQIVLEIEKTGKNVMIVDCSGFVKVSRPHLHAFDVLDSSFATKSTKMMIGNAGCVASAVIETVKQLPVLGPISVVATGGKSFASKIVGGSRSGGKWITHPHVKEIERVAKVSVNSFVPIIVPEMSESGILVVISGRLRERVQIDNRIEPICVSEVSGTEKLVRRIDVNDEGLSFTAVVAIDNIVHIAWIASQVLNRLLLL